jgi:hypothetical protein
MPLGWNGKRVVSSLGYRIGPPVGNRLSARLHVRDRQNAMLRAVLALVLGLGNSQYQNSVKK